jgi:hypothetical protein
VNAALQTETGLVGSDRIFLPKLHYRHHIIDMGHSSMLRKRREQGAAAPLRRGLAGPGFGKLAVPVGELDHLPREVFRQWTRTRKSLQRQALLAKRRMMQVFVKDNDVN